MNNRMTVGTDGPKIFNRVDALSFPRLRNRIQQSSSEAQHPEGPAATIDSIKEGDVTFRSSGLKPVCLAIRREHLWTNLVFVMESEDHIRPALPGRERIL